LRRDVGQRPKIEIVGTEIFGALLSRALDLRLAYAWLDYSDHLVCDLVLQIEDVLESAIIFFRPQMCAGFRVDKLRRDAQPIAGLAHAAFKHVANAEVAPDSSHVNWFSFGR
jgi:hypothetical protein